MSSSLHRYTYAFNSPTLLTDPTGLYPSLTEVTVVLGLAAFATANLGFANMVAARQHQTWDGWTAMVTDARPGIKAGLGVGGSILSYSEQVQQQKLKTTAFHLLIVENLSAGIPLPEGADAYGKLVSTTPGLLAGLAAFPMILGAFAAQASPIDVSIGSTTLYAPKLARGSGAALVGPYLSVGVQASVGIGFSPLITAVHSAVAGKVDLSTISTTVGGQLVIQGFGLGYSVFNTGLTLKIGIGASLQVGVSVGWGWESKENQPDPEAGN